MSASPFELRTYVAPEVKKKKKELSVRSRVCVLSGTQACPLCGLEETVSHALGGYTAIRHVLNVYWPTSTQGVSTIDLFVQKKCEVYYEVADWRHGVAR